jgi:predicted DCC family thiol-disulfide oxidoreductase YuxK
MAAKTPTARDSTTERFVAGGGRPIVFFDGVCAMCNRLVDVIVRADRRSVFRFAPLQGETARALLPPLSAAPEEWSLIYLDEHGLHDQWDAVLEVSQRLGGIWRFLGILRLVPRPIRNAMYHVVARNRYRWFGRRAACRVPSAEDRGRFLP